MSFSEVHKQSLGQWAPNGKHLAAVAQNRLLLREAETLKLVQVYVCVDKVERIEWSPDSEYVLTQVARQGIVQIWSLRECNWECRIDEGLGGVAHARWGISAQHVFVVSEFQLYLSIWKLEDKSRAVQIRHPKHPQKGLAFSHNSRWFALLRRSSCRDSVAVHSCIETFSQLTEIPVSGDFADLAWVLGDSAIVLWERPARSARFVWYSPRGELLSQIDECALLRCSFPSPTGQLLAGGCFDGSIHLLNAVSTKPLTRWTHDLKAACAEASEAEVAVLREEASGVGGPVRCVRLPNPASVRIPEERPGYELTVDADGVPRQGVGIAAWSSDERFLATRREGSPTTIWVWDLGCLALAVVLIFRTPVRSFVWDPSAASRGPCARLAISTADPLLFLWSAAVRGEAMVLPCPLSMARLQWRSDGRTLLLQERERACVCSPGLPPVVPTAGPLLVNTAQDSNRETTHSTVDTRGTGGIFTSVAELRDSMPESQYSSSSSRVDMGATLGNSGVGGALAMAALAGEAILDNIPRRKAWPMTLA